MDHIQFPCSLVMLEKLNFNCIRITSVSPRICSLHRFYNSESHPIYIAHSIFMTSWHHFDKFWAHPVYIWFALWLFTTSWHHSASIPHPVYIWFTAGLFITLWHHSHHFQTTSSRENHEFHETCGSWLLRDASKCYIWLALHSWHEAEWHHVLILNT